MRRQLAQVERKVQAARRMLGRAVLSRLPEILRRHAVDGQAPDDEVGTAYLALTQASDRVMDSTIGGQGHEEHCRRYTKALKQWQDVLQGAGL